ncbi:LETM1-related biofilm-associated protein [Flavobacterium sp. SUN052]|uniref:LETM1-related biofilm-associated protein n=1 Tax=Flavobacterium sp. SUN052 TaxID=3002441 RepID=UPI00237E4079|nr:LETM1-related biofilm-associated protein [Flavobacterium sp. SUN052]MEC4003686.1 LETM1-related biofilm-associated protein [Flavobacterium sp. SUN052]
MINPSANGWIDKYFVEQKPLFDNLIIDSLSFYKHIRQTGFIYGHIISINSQPGIEINNWKSDEISKVALLNTLFDIYCYTTKSSDYEDFITKTVAFYKEMTPKGFGFFNKIIPSSASSKLENIIDERVQTNKDIISKNFSHIVTNALLFVDVLAFRKYLIQCAIPDKYLKRIEETIMSIVSLSLQVKNEKSQHDDLLIKLFEASVRYTKFSKVNVQTLESLPLDYFTDNLENYYLLDLAGITLWNDGKVENDEIYFLYKLAETMGVSEDFVSESVVDTNTFITKHKSNIQYFNYSNPVKHFYDQTTNGVQVLIKRNKKRLIKEISESKELMILLAKSTQHDLDVSEKKKVKKQLLDICKSIPSLTIFLLPGGGLLLPILIKFIPQLLPSAFNENLDD